MREHDGMRTSPRTPGGHATGAAILEAARRVVAAEGIDGCTTRALADHAGVSIGTVYRYFADRSAVLHALARAHAHDLEMGFAAARLWRAASLDDVADLVLGVLLAAHRDDPTLAVVGVDLVALEARAEPVDWVSLTGPLHDALVRIARVSTDGAATAVRRFGPLAFALVGAAVAERLDEHARAAILRDALRVLLRRIVASSAPTTAPDSGTRAETPLAAPPPAAGRASGRADLA